MRTERAFRLHELPVDSAILRGNPLGDPHQRVLRVVAPKDPTGPLPVIWVLPAYAGTAAAMVEPDPWNENFLDQVERLHGEGTLGPAIFAIPDCFTLLGGSQYLDSPAQGRYRTHLWEEARPLVEGLLPTNGRHGVTGRSSGGYGAFVQAVFHPEHVRAVACHAADMAFEHCYLSSLPALAQAIRTHGGVGELLEAFRSSRRKRSGPWFMAIQALCMAACYSPHPGEPLGIALPMDLDTLELLPDVWERWLAHDPVRMVERPEVQDALRGLDFLFFDCGDRDEYNLQWGQRRLVRRLEALGIPHVAEEFPDGHRSTSYRWDVSLPPLVRALSG
jgi:S-formylglutathione hydrolase FrmB